MGAIDYTGDPRAVLCHANPYHDPKTGKFTTKIGGVVSRLGAGKYQNLDGTLTAKGEARFAAEKRRNALKKKENRVKDVEDLKDPVRWDQEDTENVKNLSDSAKKLTDEIANLIGVTQSTSKSKIDLSTMTDAELRERINRIKMEDEYRKLMTSNQTVDRGRNEIKQILSTAGSALATTSSAVALALAIKKLRAFG